MPANNWTRCPKCDARKETEIAQFEGELKSLYGVISIDEYKQKESSLSELKDKLEDEDELNCLSLREDYELGILDGKFDIIYKASCTECEFEYIYKFSDDNLLKG